VQAAADVVVDVVQSLSFMNREYPPAAVPWQRRTPSAPPSGSSTLAVMLCGRLSTRGPAKNGTD
jgi:hypothetical protein